MTMRTSAAVQLVPSSDVASDVAPKLADIIDTAAVQSLLEDFHSLTRIPVSIIDLQGGVLVGVGWQEVCLNFHRANPESCRNCLESDTQLVANVRPGECRMYRCKNNMWDIATPIAIGGCKLGNLFSGQFVFEDETIDSDLFRAQAARYGFEETAYMTALSRVPKLDRVSVETGMSFLTKLANTISVLGYRNMQLARSLTERQVLADSLQENRDLLAASEAIAHLGSWKLEVQNNRLSWSDEVYRIFGLRPQEFGATYEAFLDRVHPEDRATVHETYSASLRERQPSYEITHRVIRKDTGEVRWVHEKCTHVMDPDGEIIRSIGMVQDITAIKNAQDELHKKNGELLSANRSWEEFAYVVSHDLQEPLRTINIFAQMLLRRPGLRDDTDASRFVEYIGTGVTRLENLLRDLLSYVSASDCCEDVETADLNRCFDLAVADFQGRIEEIGAIVIRTDLPVVRAPEPHLTQVFQNLLSNALKYRRPGVIPQVTVSAICEGNECVVRVSDNGIGFDPEYAERIFGLFKRLHRNGYPGTGVGLAICRRIVERYGGRISAQSEGADRGSVFSFALPGGTEKTDHLIPGCCADDCNG